HGAGKQVVVATQILGGGMHDEVHAPLERTHVVRGGEGGVDDRLHTVPAAYRREPLEVEDAVVGVRRRLADQHAGGGPDRVLQRLVVAGLHGGDLDAVPVERLVEELARAPITV